MAEQTITLLASAYTTSSSPSVSVSNPSRAYTNASSATYAVVDPSSSASSWADFYGFDFSQIPSVATITNMTFKIKTKGIAPTSFSVYLWDTSGNQTISDVATHTESGTYTDTLTPTKTFSQIKALGNNFHFRIATSSSANVYVYGMEVNVTYATPVPNKVTYNGNTLIDLTSDTVTAADVALGKLFHIATGEQATGTGGGLEYESGTWSPSSDVERGSVLFTNSHDTPPAFVMVADSSRTTTSSNPATYSALAWAYGDFWRVFGNAVNAGGASSSSDAYSLFYGIYRTTSTSKETNVAKTGSASSNSYTTYSSDVTTGTINTNYSVYYADKNGFYPLMRMRTNSASTIYWRSSRTYNWIAIWK